MGPSATWYGGMALLMTIAVVVVLFDGVYWMLLLTPFIVFAIVKAVQAARNRNF